MSQSANIARALTVALALAVLAGCAQQGPPPPQATGTSGPVLAGAWYEVYFDTNQADVGVRGKMIAERVAYVVTNDVTTRVTVIGKADRAGDASANMALSQRRADAVRDALVSAGVPPARIDTTWTGERGQMVATANDTADRRNRVVDITVVKQSP